MRSLSFALSSSRARLAMRAMSSCVSAIEICEGSVKEVDPGIGWSGCRGQWPDDGCVQGKLSIIPPLHATAAGTSPKAALAPRTNPRVSRGSKKLEASGAALASCPLQAPIGSCGSSGGHLKQLMTTSGGNICKETVCKPQFGAVSTEVIHR